LVSNLKVQIEDLQSTVSTLVSQVNFLMSFVGTVKTQPRLQVQANPTGLWCLLLLTVQQLNLFLNLHIRLFPGQRCLQWTVVLQPLLNRHQLVVFHLSLWVYT